MDILSLNEFFILICAHKKGTLIVLDRYGTLHASKMGPDTDPSYHCDADPDPDPVPMFYTF